MAKLGADPEQLTRLGIQFINNGVHLITLGPTIGFSVRELDWTGPDANSFRDTWDEYERMLRRFGDALNEVGHQLIAQAQQQIMVSGGQAGQGMAFAGPAGAAVQHALGGPGGMGASLSPGVNRGNMALMALALRDGETFDKIMSYRSPAGALTEWTGGTVRSQAEKALELQRHGIIESYGGSATPGNPLESATRQALGEDGLSWTDVAGVEGSRRASGEFGYEWSAEGSTSGEWGPVDWDAQGRVRAGISGDYSASAGIGDDRLHAQFEAGVHLGASAEGSIEGGIGFVPYEARGQAMVGADATARGELTAGAEGVAVDAGADAFLGAGADAEGQMGFGEYGSAGGNVGASVGVGAHGDVSADVGWDEVSFGVDLGATLGIGADMGFEVSFNPSGVVDDIGDWGISIADELSGLNIGDLGNDLSDAIGGIGGTADDLVGGVVDVGSDAVGFVGDTVSKLNPLSW